jgi:zona occludens toxin (predicted ATPase)
MGKEIAAAALLLALVAGAAWNIYYTGEMTSELSRQAEACDSESEARLALEQWNAVKNYTHMMLRHSEVDRITDDYYSLIAAFRSGGDSDTAKRRLLWRLKALRDMERLSLGSVF